MTSHLSRRAVLAGLGGAGILVATLDVPALASTVTSTGAETPVPLDVQIDDLRVTRVLDDAGDCIGHATSGRATLDGITGRFSGTQLGGSGLMVHETIIGESILLGMGSTERITIIGGTGRFAGRTGWYIIELDPYAPAGVRSGVLRFGDSLGSESATSNRSVLRRP